MIRLVSLFAVLACLFTVTGCGAVNRNFSNSHPQVVAAPDSVSARLAEAADRASLSLEKLAAVEYSRSPNASIGPAGDAPAELKRAMTINWVGPVEPITKTIAERAGYSFMPVGAPPVVPVVISIDVENRPIIDVLRDIGLQLGARGDVKVDSSQRIIELHYPPNTGIGVTE